MRTRVLLLAGIAGTLALIIAIVGVIGALAWGGAGQRGPATALAPSTTAVSYPATAQNSTPPYQGGYYGGYGYGAGVGNDLLAAAAQVLGVQVQDVQNGIQAGHNIAQQAQAKGIDAAKIIDAFKARQQQELNGYVAAGNLTQAQADAILNMHVAMAQYLINTNGYYGGPGGYGGWGCWGGYGMMGGFGSPWGGYGNGNPTNYGPGMMGRYWTY